MKFRSGPFLFDTCECIDGVLMTITIDLLSGPVFYADKAYKKGTTEEAIKYDALEWAVERINQWLQEAQKTLLIVHVTDDRKEV